jgi:hypothetical protein
MGVQTFYDKEPQQLMWSGSSALILKIVPSGIYRTIILPVDLYGCETRSLTFKKERRLRVFENRALRRIFGPKRDEVRGNGENYITRS